MRRRSVEEVKQIRKNFLQNHSQSDTLSQPLVAQKRLQKNNHKFEVKRCEKPKEEPNKKDISMSSDDSKGSYFEETKHQDEIKT